MLQLPHSPGCLVCGRSNPHGLQLDLHVDPATSDVRVDFAPRAEHIGFEGMIHGGVLATVLDEAMVWAATWRGRRFCVCGELTVRYRQSVHVGQSLTILAHVETLRPKLVEATAKITDSANSLIATSTGKYVPIAIDQHKAFVATLISEPSTEQALAALK
ncbi:MAG TPA: PaaI family thioesterase [Tepidisphaeraceae bacterium]|nr:PaaI family thioesterase [Tepidisphaeraceae bacterium]